MYLLGTTWVIVLHMFCDQTKNEIISFQLNNCSSSSLPLNLQARPFPIKKEWLATSHHKLPLSLILLLTALSSLMSVCITDWLLSHLKKLSSCSLAHCTIALASVNVTCFVLVHFIDQSCSGTIECRWTHDCHVGC